VWACAVADKIMTAAKSAASVLINKRILLEEIANCGFPIANFASAPRCETLSNRQSAIGNLQ
ncbi:MAG TPA: hypothetical protein VF075_10730, partial [Pyrinomonadaceae bacterium]